MEQIRHVPGAVDFRIQEPNDVPQFNVKIDRSLASIVGVNAQAVTQSVLGALSGSQQVAPNFWVDPRNRVSYQINAQAPQYDLHSLDDLRNLPILGGTSGQAQIVANVASISRATTSPVEDHYNIRPVINIYGGADGKDLGYVSDHIQKLVDAARKDLPRGSFISVRGQVITMHDSYTGLYVGLAFSMLLAGECIFLPRRKPHAWLITSEQVHTIVVIIPGGFNDALKKLGAPAERMEVPNDVDTVTYGSANLTETIKVFEQYGVRLLTPAEISKEMPEYPSRGVSLLSLQHAIGSVEPGLPMQE